MSNRKKREYYIDGQGNRKVDKRTPYKKALDRAAELEAKLRHEQARNAELTERVEEAESAAADRFISNVKIGIESRELNREFVAVGIENADLKVKLAEANREIVKLMGDNVLREVAEEGRVTIGVDPASRDGDYTAFAAIEQGEVRILSVRKSFDETTRFDFELRGPQFEGTASFFDVGVEQKIIEQMIEAYANQRNIKVQLL